MNTISLLAPHGTHATLADCLADAEREVSKLRRLLVVKLCDCRRLTTTLPLEPVMHKPTCEYRKALS
jgi:hypothetical protein